MTTETTAIAKPARAVRSITSNVRGHLSAMQRAQDTYFAKLKRAEADYFDVVKRATDAIAQEGEEQADNVVQQVDLNSQVPDQAG